MACDISNVPRRKVIGGMDKMAYSVESIFFKVEKNTFESDLFCLWNNLDSPSRLPSIPLMNSKVPYFTLPSERSVLRQA